jgi:hypothetical protein
VYLSPQARRYGSTSGSTSVHARNISYVLPEVPSKVRKYFRTCTRIPTFYEGIYLRRCEDTKVCVTSRSTTLYFRVRMKVLPEDYHRIHVRVHVRVRVLPKYTFGSCVYSLTDHSLACRSTSWRRWRRMRSTTRCRGAWASSRTSVERAKAKTNTKIRRSTRERSRYDIV